MDSTITAMSIPPTVSTPSYYCLTIIERKVLTRISLHQTQLSAETHLQCSSRLHLIAHHI